MRQTTIALLLTAAVMAAGNAQAQDHFGTSVAVISNRVAVGCPRENTPAGTTAGALYTFVYDGSA